MITAILSIGIASVLITAVIRGISATMRGVVSWTFASIAFCAALVVYYACGGAVVSDFGAVLSGLFGAMIVAVIVLAIELFAPSKRLRTKEKPEYDRESAENAHNIIMVILAASGAAAALIADSFGGMPYSVFGLVPAAAISVRQLSYFMHRVKLDTMRTDNAAEHRTALLKSLSSGKQRL